MKTDSDKPTPPPLPKKPVGKVFDVQRPGKAAAAPASRPVVLGHKPAAQQAQTAVSGVGEARPLLSRRKIQILPSGKLETAPTEESPSNEPAPTAASSAVTAQDKEALAAAALDAATEGPESEAEQAPRPIMDKPKLTIQPPTESTEAEEPPAPTTTPKTEPIAPDDGERLVATSSVPEEPAVAPESEAQKESAEGGVLAEAPTAEETLQETAQEAGIEPLFDESGSVVVSNHEHNHRRHAGTVFVLILLILVLAVLALDLLLDLEVINLNGLPHTNLL